MTEPGASAQTLGPPCLDQGCSSIIGWDHGTHFLGCSRGAAAQTMGPCAQPGAAAQTIGYPTRVELGFYLCKPKAS